MTTEEQPPPDRVRVDIVISADALERLEFLKDLHESPVGVVAGEWCAAWGRRAKSADVPSVKADETGQQLTAYVPASAVPDLEAAAIKAGIALGELCSRLVEDRGRGGGISPYWPPMPKEPPFGDPDPYGLDEDIRGHDRPWQ